MTIPRAYRPPDTCNAHAVILTGREREVAALVTEGLTNNQIGERLVISERTVESHVERIMDKLSRHSRAEIAAWMSAPGRP